MFHRRPHERPTRVRAGAWSRCERANHQRPSSSPPIADALERRVLLSTYYVSGSAGNDSNVGTLFNQPFKTIQRAANAAQPGDTVQVLNGNYRETVTPARSGTPAAPITFRRFGTHTPTISGADVLGTNPSNPWTAQGSVYHLNYTVPAGFADGEEQVFVDGQMMFRSRLPATPNLDVSAQQKYQVSALVSWSGYTVTIESADLTKPTGYFNGSFLHIIPGGKLVGETVEVTNYVGPYDDAGGHHLARLTYQLNADTALYAHPASPGDLFYIYGKVEDITSGEYFATNGSLYLQTPLNDSPTGHTVEAKARQVGINLNGRSNIVVDGLNLFACTVTTDAASHDLTLKNFNAKYVSHFSKVTSSAWDFRHDSGIQLLGSNITVDNADIQYSAGNGITMGINSNTFGTYNRVTRTKISDVNYLATDNAAIFVRGFGHVIEGNELINSGRDLIQHSHAWNIKILHNEMKNPVAQTVDFGATYAHGGPDNKDNPQHGGGGSEIAYNYVHDVYYQDNGHDIDRAAAGIFLDNYAQDFSIHHNVVALTDITIKLNAPTHNNKVWNNTLDAFAGGNSVAAGAGPNGDNSTTGSVLQNNIFMRSNPELTAFTRYNNYIIHDVDPGFVDRANGNYQLTAGATVRDAGDAGHAYDSSIPYSGSLPDIGAYEYGLPAWVYGRTYTPSAPSVFVVTGDVGGVLADDSIVVQVDGTDLVGYVNGVERYRTASSGVQRVAVYGLGGNDTITINNAVTKPVIAYGGDGADTVNAPGGGVTAYGEDGSDTLNGAAGEDYLQGNAGDDWVAAAAGNDVIDGRDGNDALDGGDGNDTLVGGAGDDTMQGWNGNDLLVGGAGGDDLDGGSNDVGQVDIADYSSDGRTAGVTVTVGVDRFDGIAGFDSRPNGWQDDVEFTIERVVGTGLPDTMTGREGNDTLEGRGNNDTLHGSLGNDTLAGGEANDSVYGDEGTDTVYGDDVFGHLFGNDYVDGGLANDVCYGGAGDDEIHGGDGDDNLWGGTGADVLEGGTNATPGGDIAHYDDAVHSDPSVGIGVLVNVGNGADDGNGFDISSGHGDDVQSTVETVIGTPFGDEMRGNDSANTFYGRAGNDLLVGGLGNDTLQGEGGDDVLWGDAELDDGAGGGGTGYGGGYGGTSSGGNDYCYGGLGNDAIHGGYGNDTLNGAEGDDVLWANDGLLDILVGGLGNDDARSHDSNDGVKPADIELW